jgi:mannan endo-1,4-beta-mannosidase
MIDNFIDYYNDPRSVFANEMGDLTRIAVYAQDNSNVAGYIYSPVSGSRVLESITIEANAIDVPDGSIVSFVAKNKTDVVVEIHAQKYANDTYKGTLTSEQLALLGKSAGTMSLVVGGIAYNTINLKYNIPEPVVDPTIVDTFEDYEGDDDILNSKWSAEKGSGCNITTLLSDKSYAGGYGLEFAYSLVAGGYIGHEKHERSGLELEKRARIMDDPGR